LGLVGRFPRKLGKGLGVVFCGGGFCERFAGLSFGLRMAGFVGLGAVSGYEDLDLASRVWLLGFGYRGWVQASGMRPWGSAATLGVGSGLVWGWVVVLALVLLICFGIFRRLDIRPSQGTHIWSSLDWAFSGLRPCNIIGCGTPHAVFAVEALLNRYRVEGIELI